MVRSLFRFPVLLLLFLGFATNNCYTRPKKSGILDYMNFSNLVLYMTGVELPLEVQVNGLTGGTLVVELGSTGEQLTFTGPGADAFEGLYEPNQVYTMSIVTNPVTTPTQTCIISNPSLTLTFSSKTFVVNCAENWYKVNIAVSAIAPTNNTDLGVLNNAVELITTQTNGTISFNVGDGMPYDITIGAVPTFPNTHVCQILGTPSGTIAAADVNLKINCLSIMSTSFAGGAYMPSTKPMVFTFSGPVYGCILDSTGGGPPYYAGAAVGGTNLNYPGNTVQIVPVSAPWSFGGAVLFPQQVNFTLNGCTDGDVVANSGAALSVTVKMLDGDVYFVSDATGNNSNSCMAINDACKTIQAAVSECTSSYTCNVFVEGGTYPIATAAGQITMTSTAGVRLLGSFDPTFTTQNLDLTPSIIKDTRVAGACGTTGMGTNECVPIIITPGGMFGDTKKAHIFQGFSVWANTDNRFSAAIKIAYGDTNSFSYLFGNYISGGDLPGTSYSGSMRVGIYLLGSQSNNQIDMNVIKGGIGVDNSHAIYSSDASMYLFRNRLSADTAIWNASAIDITNYSNRSMAIINNTINFRHKADNTVSSFYSYGINSNELSVASSLYYIAGNTIYAGGGTNNNTAMRIAGPVASNAQILNNILQVPNTASSPLCAEFQVTPSASAIFQGNNLDCSSPGKLLVSNSVNYPYYCTDGTFNSGTVLCILLSASFLDTTRGNQNFTKVPVFTAPPIGKPWLAFFPTPGVGAPCAIAYGGVETNSYFIADFDTFYKQDAVIGSSVSRTASFGGSTPSGSSGYSIGAFEIDDPSCSP